MSSSSSVAGALATLNQVDPKDLSNGERGELIGGARSLLYRLLGPKLRVLEQTSLDPFNLGVLKALQDLQVFEKWQTEGKKAMTTAEVATLVGADPILIGRLLRYLATMEGIDIVGPDLWQMNDYSKHLADKEAKACVDVGVTIFSPAAQQMAPWLSEIKYNNPTDANNTAFIRSTPHQKDTHFFKWLTEDPKRISAYETVVAVTTASTKSWVHLLPMEHLVPPGTTAERVTLVDVGGGHGGPIEEFRTKLSDPTRRLVLQDQPQVIEQLNLHDSIELMAYDFFTPQPVKGARIYFMKFVMHDWPLDKCKEILKNQASAMEKGFSKLLINEQVVSVEQPTALSASLDMIMMNLGSATERTQKQWQDLVSGTGLKIVKIWPGVEGSESVIECELE